MNRSLLHCRRILYQLSYQGSPICITNHNKRMTAVFQNLDLWVYCNSEFHVIFPLFLNWKKTALQCCVGFCHPTTQISRNYTYITSLSSLPSLPPSYPSRLPQSTIPVVYSNFMYLFKICICLMKASSIQKIFLWECISHSLFLCLGKK